MWIVTSRESPLAFATLVKVEREAYEDRMKKEKLNEMQHTDL
jgi:hypothetical protein